MKNILTPAQSFELIKLGISEEKASIHAHISDSSLSPVFTLSDLLTILQKDFNINDRFTLSIRVDKNTWDIGYYDFFLEDNSFYHISSDTELIDALYFAIVYLINKQNNS